MCSAARHNYLPSANPQQAFWGTAVDEFDNHCTTPELPEVTDVLIIGAGYAGTATAWHLTRDRDPSKPKQSITVLEARGICSGATGRNGGHLRPDLYGHIPTYIKRAGLEAAVELAEFEIAHVPILKQFIEEEKIDCDFVLSRCIDTWSNEEAAKEALQTYETLKGHSLAYMNDVFFKYGDGAPGVSGAIHAKATASYTAGMMWPYKFIRHVLKSLVAFRDINLQTNCPVMDIIPGGDSFLVKTARGTVKAGKIVHANNAYVSGLLPEYIQSIVPCKGICCRIKVPEGKVAPGMTCSYIERSTDDTGSYLIPRPDGSIIVGGAQRLFKPHLDHWYDNVDDSVLIDSAKRYYDGYMQRTFAGWEDSEAKVDQIWTGVMGYSFDSHSHIGAVPDRPGQYVIAGFNGHGMPVIWLSGKGLARMINDNVPFEKTGIPRLLKTTKERIERAQSGNVEHGDILGDGSAFPLVR